MRVVLADDRSRGSWRDGPHRFIDLVAPLHARGCEVTLLDAADCGPAHVVTGCLRERDGAPLTASFRLATALLRAPPDLCLFPAEDGLAHATLMARACRELSADTRVALWQVPQPPRSARTTFRAADGLRALTAAAMRRFCADMADRAIEHPLPSATTMLVGSPASAREIVFCGPFAREHGFVAFVEAVELLERRGRLDGRLIVFVGAFVDGGAIDREWFGRRAGGWTFRFHVREAPALAQAVPAAVGRDRIALVVGAEPARVTRIAPDVRVDRLSAATCLAASELADLFSSGGGGEGGAAEFDEVIDHLLATPDSVRSCGERSVGLSVCVLHHERPVMLQRALDSVCRIAPKGAIAQVEIVVLDNASRSPAALAALTAAAARPDVRVIFLPEPTPYSSALNTAAAHATQDFLVFLDDDNVVAPGGLSRLAAACAAGAFDVVTSTLDLFDTDPTRPVGSTTFIGPAFTAGLFFNGFGDTSMAFCRKSFISIGGFLDRSGPYPSADWILLARAQAAGLRIGVLQQAAFGYQRNATKVADHWQPWDREMVRSLLLEHYGDAFDPHDLAGAAQAMALGLGI